MTPQEFQDFFLQRFKAIIDPAHAGRHIVKATCSGVVLYGPLGPGSLIYQFRQDLRKLGALTLLQCGPLTDAGFAQFFALETALCGADQTMPAAQRRQELEALMAEHGAADPATLLMQPFALGDVHVYDFVHDTQHADGVLELIGVYCQAVAQVDGTISARAQSYIDQLLAFNARSGPEAQAIARMFAPARFRKHPVQQLARMFKGLFS